MGLGFIPGPLTEPQRARGTFSSLLSGGGKLGLHKKDPVPPSETMGDHAFVHLVADGHWIATKYFREEDEGAGAEGQWVWKETTFT